MASNKTGKPNTNDYLLGRGEVYISTLTAGLPGTWRDLGNSPEFSLSVASESVDHQGSRLALKLTDKSVTISQSVGVNFSLDEFNDQNWALALSGTNVEAQINAAVAGFAEYAMIPSVTKGRWYDIQNSSRVRAMGIVAADLTVEKSGSPDVAMVLGTDYELDLEMGRIFILTSGSVVANGDTVDVTLTARVGAKSIDRVRALTQLPPVFALKFISSNAANSSKKREFLFHQVSLKPSGDIALIGDDYAAIAFEGKAEQNLLADANSPTLTISEVQD